MDGTEANASSFKGNLHKNSPNDFFFEDLDVRNTVHKNDETRGHFIRRILILLLAHGIIITYISYVTYYYISTRDTCTQDCTLTFCSSYGMLLFLFGTIYVCLFYFKILKPYLGKFIVNSIFSPIGRGIKSLFKTLVSRIILGIVVLAAFIGYILYETYEDFARLRALGGIAVFICVGFAISASPRNINWRPVICGALFQFILGVLFIRWPVGRNIFQCFGEKVSDFLDFGKMGAAFVYGDHIVFELGVFAFAILSSIYFFSLWVSVLYYLGAMQWFLFKLGWILQSILGTTVCESVNAAGNIFLGMSEGPLMIKPHIKNLTHSEFHAIITSGFSTVSGSVLAAYTSFGAEPSHLITASVMAAPASLFMAKLIYPETEESKTSSSNIQLEKSYDTSVLDAASNGASQATDLIINIIANLIAFVALITFADALLMWITGLMGFESIDLQFIFGKVFMPISWLIGVDWKDCEAVGNVIGTKTIINEFVAFKVLGDYIERNEISPRSAAIATFAICSFANPGSIGIAIGSLSALAPSRRPSITKVAFRALIAACFVTLCTASIAGLLMTDEMIER
ncbi:uncharacterized transporter YutK-like [Chironomus tepperi]|uniref:uncharacterized transporter YutK-like n=1 Tax=Chironomus tepperi TaxID=113505 RepID=UPI00391F8D5F